ncbi:MAG: hypothetical protein A2Y15_04930 [Clostridiales bacterium GWF2_36_10]|nr:MAG: hypothetical protein A2Y15_04930 [Clostridiales bacterium GWF2_36_10]HAN21101.1 DNA helicase [Clostridiales bacterium]
MPLKEHADYSYEKQRLDETIQYVNTSLNKNICNAELLRKDTIEVFKELDYRDSNLVYDQAALNAFLYKRESIMFTGLTRAQRKPYFCRIDVKLSENEQTKKLYIGKMALTGEDIENPLIVDWRAPIASVYYNGRLGDVVYDSPDGEQKIELNLKRQYTINDGILENIMDVDITTTDTFLQAALGENKDNRLQDIVSTIQAEQNDIIRADIYSPIIVQGVAGSGKTTIALHRIAYLIYTFEKDFDPSDFLIIAPNTLFLNYISEVLPELGVERVKQTTFIDIAFELLGKKYNLTDPDEKLIKFISNSKNFRNKETELLRRVSEYKSSLDYRDAVDNYVASLEQTFIPDQDFCLGEHVIIKADVVKHIFLTQFSHLPLYKRIPFIKNFLSSKLKNSSKNILQNIENDYDQQINALRRDLSPSAERKEKIVALMDARDENLEFYKNAAKYAVVKYLSLLPKKQDIINYYKELITASENCRKFFISSDDEFIMYFCKHNNTLFRKRLLEFEDLSPLMYLKYKIFGFETEITTKYIVIDEAQDFSLFQIYTLKKIFDTELFTLLGDLAQGIHSYRGIKNWQDVIDKVLQNNFTRYLTLNQSYRTTVEIMNAANEFIKISNISNIELAKPVVRHGNKPAIYRFSEKEALIQALEDKINYLKSIQYKTIAIICKTNDDCSIVKFLLNKRGNKSIRQLSSEDITYEGGTIIVPSYLAKGLEFDAVIICTLTEDYSLEELDLKLLYVSMTRALHCLDFLCLYKNMKILDLVPEDFIQRT